MSVLVLAEHDNAELKRPSLNAVTAALAVGGEVHVLVAGSSAAPVAEAAARIAGVAKVLHADDPAYAHALAENLAPLMVGLADGYRSPDRLGHHPRQERHAPGCRPARRGAGLRHHRGGVRERLRAADPCGQRARHRREQRRQEGRHRAHHRVRRRTRRRRRCPHRGGRRRRRPRGWCASSATS